MKKMLIIFLIGIILICCACSGQQKPEIPQFNQPDEIVYGTDLQGNGGGRAFEKRLLTLPDIGVYITKSVKLTDGNIFLYGTDTWNDYFYILDTSSFEIRKIELLFPASVIDISKTHDGGVAVLSIDSEGEYVISVIGLRDDEINTLKLHDNLHAEDNVLWGLCARTDGFLLIANREVLAINMSGEIINTYGPYNGSIQLCQNEGDQIFIVSFSQKETGVKIQTVDDKYNLSKTYLLNNSFDAFYDAFGSGLFGYSSNTIYYIDIISGTRQGYVNTFASGGGASNFIYIDDNTFFALYGGAPSVWTPSDITDLHIMKLATYRADSSLTMAVTAFNNSNPKYKIDLIDYSSFDEAGSINKGLNRLNIDIVSGNAPDIFDLQVLPARAYAAKGLLQNLIPYFEEDTDLSVTDLIPSVIKALEYHGELYDCVPVFRLMLMYGDNRIIGQSEHWNISDFLALTKQYSISELLGNEITRDEFLQYILIFNNTNYADIVTGTCNFQDGSFEKLLELSAKLPTEVIPTDSQRWGKAYIGEQVLLLDSFGEFLIDDLLIDNAIFHGNTNYIGFPSDYGTGIAMVPIIRLGMSSSSKNQDAVWAFFKFLLSEQYQTDMITKDGQILPGKWVMPGIPTLSSALEKRLDYWTAQRATEPAKLSSIANGANVVIEGSTSDESTKQLANSLIDRIGCVAELDDSLFEIIITASSPYYSGEKSLEETVALIQKRASIYIAEQYS